MAIWNPFRKKKSLPVVPQTPQSKYHRNRISDLESRWYSVHRGFLNSPNHEVRMNLEKTRELSRLLTGIDPYAAKYVELLSVYVVGEQGMLIDPRNTLSNGSLDQATNSKIRDAWNDWTQEASYDGRSSFHEMEQMAIRTIGRDGECIFRIVRGKSVNRFGFALQSIDPALLDITHTAQLRDGNYVVMGVEYDYRGRPAAYHIYNRYPSDAAMGIARQRERIPADEVIHIFDDDYGNLVRGMPWLTPGLQTLAKLHEYMDSHLLACQIAASAPLVMTNEGTETPAYDNVAVSNTVNSDGSTTTTSNAPEQVLNLSYSQILELPLNKKIEALNLQFPQTNFQQAVKTYMQAIAAALQVSYESLTGDFSNTNYSSGRLGSIIERDHWKQVQKWLAARFHRKVFNAWIEAALLSGQIKLPGTSDDYLKVAFIPRGFRYVDPVKDLKAYVEGINHGLFTRQQIVAELGGNWQDNVMALEQEQNYAQEHNVSLGTAATVPITPESLQEQIDDINQNPKQD